MPTSIKKKEKEQRRIGRSTQVIIPKNKNKLSRRKRGPKNKPEAIWGRVAVIVNKISLGVVTASPPIVNKQ